MHLTDHHSRPRQGFAPAPDRRRRPARRDGTGPGTPTAGRPKPSEFGVLSFPAAVCARAVTVGLIIIVLAACSPRLHVKVLDLDTRSSPESFATYRWERSVLQEAGPGERPDEQYSDVIRNAIDTVLARQGFRRAPTDPSAMIVDFQLTVKKTLERFPSDTAIDPEDEAARFGLRWRLPEDDRPVRIERMTPDEEVRYLEEGMLHIAVFAPDQTPVWHATGHKILDRSHTREEHRQVLESSVVKMLSRFPSSSRRSSVPSEES